MVSEKEAMEFDKKAVIIEFVNGKKVKGILHCKTEFDDDDKNIIFYCDILSYRVTLDQIEKIKAME